MRLLCALVCVLLSTSAWAERIIKNDNVGESVNNPTASAQLISGESYEAVFDIPAEYMPENSGRPLNITGVRVLMVNDPMKPGRACGRFSFEIYEEPPGASAVESTCTVIDLQTFQTSNPRHKAPGTKLFDLAQVPVPMGPLGFVIEGSPAQGNASFQDLTIAAINQNQGVNIQPIAVTTNRIRVAITALDEQCGAVGQGDYFPIMVSDTNGVAGDSMNFIYGREPNFCPTFRHYVWEDFAPAFSATPGDWLIRLIVDYDDFTNPDPDMGMDMGSDMGIEDMGTADMDEMDMGVTEDSGPDMPVSEDMGSDLGNNNGNNGTNNGTNNGEAVFTLSSITPDSGPSGASTDVVLVGAGFEPGVEVLIGTEAIGVRETRPGRISATVPEGLALGTYDVIVTNPNGDTAILQDAYTVVDGEGLDRVNGADDGCGFASTQGSGSALLVFVFLGVLRLRRRSA